MEELPSCLPKSAVAVIFDNLVRDDLADGVRLCAAYPSVYDVFKASVKRVAASALAPGSRARDAGMFGTAAALKTLELSHMTRLIDIGPLDACRALERLSLRGCEELRSVASLASCIRLMELDVSHTLVEDLAPLTSCSDLRILRASGCPNLRQLPPMPALRELNASHCHGLTGLAACEALVRADVSETHVQDLAPFGRCPKLQELLASGNDIDDLTFLKNCGEVTRLDVSYTHVSDLNPVAKSCKGLVHLDVSYSDVTDVKMLALLPHLRSLDMSGCRSEDDAVASLVLCLSLKSLSIKNCKALRDLTPLLECPALEALSAEGCTKVVDFEAFARRFAALA
jgi:Leucine-rich repeat (LRR) protein